MSSMERYIKQVLDSIFSAPEDRERLEKDLRAHFADGQAAGTSEAEIIRRMGPPREVAASFMEGVEPRFAGFWIRALAFGADLGAMGLLTLPLFCLMLLFVPAEGGARISLALIPLVVAPIALWTLALYFFYFPVLEHRVGKTLGKHLLGLRVQSEERTRVGLGAAFLRRLSLYFEFLVLDALFVPFTEKKQRAFDIVAHTVVVRERVPVPVAGWLLAVALIVAPLLLLGVVSLLALAAEGS